MDYTIEHAEILKYIESNTPVIIGCNHQSTWETFIFSLYFDNLAIVIKQELLNIPIAGLYFKKLGCLPIDRSHPIAAIRSLLHYGQQAIDQNQNILIFPNGTRSENAEYKSGLFALYKQFDLPVVPIYVNSGKFWARHSFKKLPGKIVVSIKPPILPGLPKNAFWKEFNKEMDC